MRLIDIDGSGNTIYKQDNKFFLQKPGLELQEILDTSNLELEHLLIITASEIKLNKYKQYQHETTEEPSRKKQGTNLDPNDKY